MAEAPARWSDIEAAGGIRNWALAELRKQGLLDEGVDTSKLGDAQRKQYKARREEERRVRRLLHREGWAAYRREHLVHVGVGIFYHDTADIDRFDIVDAEQRRRDNQLPEIKDAGELAKQLELPVGRMRWLCYHREVDTGTHYQRWLVPKSDGGQRLISAPKHDLKAAQRWIMSAIVEHLPVHGQAHGFIAGRSTKTNALAHAGAAVVVKLDLKDFYPSISFPRVKGLFRKAGYNEQVATVLGLLCTEAPREELMLRGKRHYVATGPRSLPQGAPTSPSITNALCLRLDLRMSGLSRKLGCHYSRYADDLTFSWKDKAAEQKKLGRLLRHVNQILREEGFVLHGKKTRVMRQGGRQKVTGLVVNHAPGRPAVRVPRKLVRQLRAALHNRRQGKPGKGETLAQLRGWAAYIHMTDPVRGRAFTEEIDRLEAKEQP
jgi:hypothetical protein